MVDGSSLPRSVRWRIQLGLLEVPEKNEEQTEFLERLIDLNRIAVNEQRSRYDALVQKHFSSIHPQEEIDPPQIELPSNDHLRELTEKDDGELLDPLTAMVMEQDARENRRKELDLKYRKERARRNRGISVDAEDDDLWEDQHVSPTQTLSIISKDLHRLQPEHYTYYHTRKNLRASQKGYGPSDPQPLHTENSDPTTEFDESVKERTDELSQILHVHAMEHPHLGYRQGMHEIASYFLLVAEMDLFECEALPTIPRQGSISNLAATPDFLDHTVEEQNLKMSKYLLDHQKILHDVYTVFEKVMKGLERAYDVSAQGRGQKSSMEDLGNSIVSKLCTVACDRALHKYISRLTFPPQLYCTRWVRLMFSREVTGWRNVLLLWDVFFDFVTVYPSIYASKGQDQATLSSFGHFELQDVLEITAASMVLMVRDKLFKCQDANESIQVLMNYNPFTDLEPLIETLRTMLQRAHTKDGVTPIRPHIVESNLEEEETTSSSGHLPSGAAAAVTNSTNSNGGGGGGGGKAINMIRGAVQSMDTSLRELNLGATFRSISVTREDTGNQNGAVSDSAAIGSKVDVDPLLGVVSHTTNARYDISGTASPSSRMFAGLRRAIVEEELGLPPTADEHGSPTGGGDPLQDGVSVAQAKQATSAASVVPGSPGSADSIMGGLHRLYSASSFPSPKDIASRSNSNLRRKSEYETTPPDPLIEDNPDDATGNVPVPFADFTKNTQHSEERKTPRSALPCYRPSAQIREELLSRNALAEKLNESMLTIQTYLVRITQPTAEVIPSPDTADTVSSNKDKVSNVPKGVWEALAEIDVVRKRLLVVEGDTI